MLKSIAINSSLSNRQRHWLQYFAFVAFFLPAVDMSGYSSIFNGIVPNVLGYKFLALLLSLPFLTRLQFRMTDIKGVIIAVLIATLYQLAEFGITVGQTGFLNTLTIYRHSFCQCLHLMILLPFILKQGKEEIDYIFALFYRYIIVLSIIYLLDNLFFHVLQMLALGKILAETRGGVSVERSIIGFPPIIGGWIFFFFAIALNGGKKARNLFVLCIFTIFISFTRSMMLEAVIGCSVVAILLILKKSEYITKTFKITLIFLLGALLLIIVYPDSIHFWEAKLSETFNTELVDNEGTYAFRERLIEQAQNEIKNNPLTGNGYVRDTAKGEYSMVLGGDTFIAPILLTEGYLGLGLRVFPYFVLLLITLHRYNRFSNPDAVDMAIIGFIISSCFGYVQTKAIVCYPLTLMILILLKQKQYHNERAENIDNYGLV